MVVVVVTDVEVVVVVVPEEAAAAVLEPAVRAAMGRAVANTLVPVTAPLVFMMAMGTVDVPVRLVTTDTIGLAITRLVSGEAVRIVVPAVATLLAGRDTTVVDTVVVVVSTLVAVFASDTIALVGAVVVVVEAAVDGAEAAVTVGVVVVAVAVAWVVVVAAGAAAVVVVAAGTTSLVVAAAVGELSKTVCCWGLMVTWGRTWPGVVVVVTVATVGGVVGRVINWRRPSGNLTICWPVIRSEYASIKLHSSKIFF